MPKLLLHLCMTDTHKKTKKKNTIYSDLDSLTHLLEPKKHRDISLSMDLKTTTSP